MLVGTVCRYSLKAQHLVVVVLLVMMQKEREPFPSFYALHLLWSSAPFPPEQKEGC